MKTRTFLDLACPETDIASLYNKNSLLISNTDFIHFENVIYKGEYIVLTGRVTPL